MPPPTPHYAFEQAALSRGARIVAGVDEVGRGPLAGPVVAAAVVLDPARLPAGLSDSKALSAKRRETLTEEIRACAQVGLGIATVEEIDALNILRASHLAMCRALRALPVAPCHALIDGKLLPRDNPCGCEGIVRGDGRSVSIAAASIVAKTWRDAHMVELAQHFPGYGWETNAGYGTKGHRSALQTLGATPYHRRSFRPVHDILCRDENVTA
ncbi:ribonuclease HII [Wenxinia saemankumensis]|uniref:Ribonuclease HII n=1 Tax=Wenxinia saemankumensis TaxID=1447782 RepID=A0A1M6FK77_9RHOB|nr:ribonuclease HII [Wenxinia saemankumensis]SHI98073.1 RNase HII [Wenxinia saemankumensis]